MNTVVLIILVLLLFGGIGAAPTWGYSRGYGWGPSGIIGLILVVVLILALMGRF